MVKDFPVFVVLILFQAMKQYTVNCKPMISLEKDLPAFLFYFKMWNSTQ